MDKRNLAAMKWILDHQSIDINMRNKSYQDASLLDMAIMKDDDAMVGLLLKKGANANAPPTRMMMTPLKLAIIKGCTEVAERLIRAGADVNATDGDDDDDDEDNNGKCFRVIHSAAEVGDLKIMELLLKSGAMINEVSPNDDTAWSIAVARGNHELASFLLKNGAKRIGPGTFMH